MLGWIDFNSCTACSTELAERDAITTDAPSWAKALAIARPNPREPPVMTATFPLNFSILAPVSD